MDGFSYFLFLIFQIFLNKQVFLQLGGANKLSFLEIHDSDHGIMVLCVFFKLSSFRNTC